MSGSALAIVWIIGLLVAGHVISEWARAWASRRKDDGGQ